MATAGKSAICIVVTLGNLRIRILQNASEILNGSSEAPAAEKKQDPIGRQLAVGRMVLGAGMRNLNIPTSCW